MKILKSILAVGAMMLSAQAFAETYELWHSDEPEGVTPVDWNKVFNFNSNNEHASDAVVGSNLCITVESAGTSGWPQVALFDANLGWPPLVNQGVGGKEYPYVAEFSVDKAMVDLINGDGLTFSADCPISKIELVTPDCEIEEGATWAWAGERVLKWNGTINIPKSVFSNVKTSDKIVVYYDNTQSCYLQFIFGGWSGVNIDTNTSAFVTNDTAEGKFIFNLGDNCKNVAKGEEEYDLFELLKANDLMIQGDGTVTQVAYVPSVEPEGGCLVGITTDQGHGYDDFDRCPMNVTDDYIEYAYTGGVQAAFKMQNIDVAGCDYILVKFAEAVPGGWSLSFTADNNAEDVPAGATEYRFNLNNTNAPDGVLPELSLLSIFKGNSTIKVEGVYKHYPIDNPTFPAIALTHSEAYTNTLQRDGVDVTYTREFKHDGWQALYVPYPMKAADWSANGTVAVLESVGGTAENPVLVWSTIDGGTLSPNTPYLYKPNATGVVEFGDTETSVFPNNHWSVSKESDAYKCTLTGIYAEKTNMQTTGAYGMSNGAFYQASTDDQHLKPFQIFLTVEPKSAAPSQAPKRFGCLIDNQTTGIADFIIVNNNDGKVYDLQGREVQNPTTGIYIVNGKKVMINK